MTECQVSRLQDEVAELQERLERLREGGRWLMTCLYAAADPGGCTRREILLMATDAATRWPELAPWRAAIGDSQ